MNLEILPSNLQQIRYLLDLKYPGLVAKTDFIKINDLICNTIDEHLVNALNSALVETPLFYIAHDAILEVNPIDLSTEGTAAQLAHKNGCTFKSVTYAEDVSNYIDSLAEKIIGLSNTNVKILMFKSDPRAKDPKVAYQGTSAAFDIASIQDVTIGPFSGQVVPVGLHLSIDQNQPYYMQINLRSSLGFKKHLQCHQGIVDAGYTGDFGVLVHNPTANPVTIREGDYFAQVVVHRKPTFEIVELDKSQWQKYEQSQIRGSNGFGSSGK